MSSTPKWLREASAKDVVSALLGCSMELSLCNEVAWEPGMLTEAALREDEALLLGEIKRRLKNEDPDMQDAVGEGSEFWKRAMALVESKH